MKKTLTAAMLGITCLCTMVVNSFAATTGVTLKEDQTHAYSEYAYFKKGEVVKFSLKNIKADNKDKVIYGFLYEKGKNEPAFGPVTSAPEGEDQEIYNLIEKDGYYRILVGCEDKQGMDQTGCSVEASLVSAEWPDGK